MSNITKRIIFYLITFIIIINTLFINNVSAEDNKVTIDAEDNAELYSIVEKLVESGTKNIQINVSGTLTYETGSGHNSDKLTKLGTIEELIIVGTTKNAKFVQTGVGVDGMSVTNGKLIFNNITIEDTTVYKSENGESAWEFCYAEYSGNVEFNNCAIRGEYGGIMTNGNAVFSNCEFIAEKNGHGGVEYALWVNNGTAELRNCKFSGNRAFKTHEAYGSNVQSVLIDNCEFIKITQKPGLAIGNLDATTEVTIKNSKFYACQPGDNNLYIYESDTNVANFILNLENNIVSEHVLRHIPEVKATYALDGNIEYWICLDCDKWFSDNAATKEIDDKNSVILQKLVEVTEGKADVSEEAVTEAINNSNSNNIVLSLPQTEQNVTSVQLPTNSINNVIQEDKALTIETSELEITFDNEALKSIINTSNSSKVTLEVKEIEEENLTDKQKEAIADKEITTIISAELLSENEQIKNFGDGNVTIKIPFIPKEGTEGSDYIVLYVDDDGSIEEISTKFENNSLIVNLKHFSKYVIAQTKKEEQQQPADNTIIDSSNTTTNNTPSNNVNNISTSTNNNAQQAPSTNSTNNVPSISPKTGDTSIIEVWVTMLIISSIGLIAIFCILKNKTK